MIGNKLLKRFPSEDLAKLETDFRITPLPVGEVVCEPGRPVRFVCFPLTGLLSSVVTFENGESVEAATVGNEGAAGLESLIDDRSSPYRVIQQVAGEVVQVPADAIRAAAEASSGLREVLGRYALTLAQQYAQNAACNLHHRVEKRMCRWLLSTADRVGREGFGVTQEFLSEMLGVSRQSVSLTAGQLQQAGLIAYRRGNLRITDRTRLEEASCECYRATKNAYDRLMRTSAA